MNRLECAIAALADDMGYVDLGPITIAINAMNIPWSGVAELVDQGKASLESVGLGQGTTWYKLDWHEQNAAAQSTNSAAYPNAPDLKKWLIQVPIDANAQVAGDQTLADARDQILPDLGSAVANLPQTLGTAAAAATQYVAQTAASVASGAAGGVAKGLGLGLFSNPLGLLAIGAGLYFAWPALKKALI